MEIRHMMLFFGILLALFAILCASATFQNPKDRNLFGIPIGLIGAFGYGAMLLASTIDEDFYYGLLSFTLVVTVMLIVKSIRLRKVCMFCVFCWLLNIALCIEAYKSLRA